MRLLSPLLSVSVRLVSYISLALAVTIPAFAQPDRIPGRVDPTITVTLEDQVPARAQTRFDRGAVEAGFPIEGITLVLKPEAEQQSDLDQLLLDQQDPNSRQFHRWLTTQAFADRFAPSPADLHQITNWLESQGFQITAVSGTRNWVAVNGTAGTVLAALGAEVHRYTVDGEDHFGNSTAPRIPAALAGIVAGFRGLDDFLLKAPVTKLTAAFTPAESGNHYLAPGDIASIYNLAPLYAGGTDGTGQSLVVVGQTSIDLGDIRSFRSLFGLPKNDPRVVLVPGLPDPGLSPPDLVEADLDLEWAGATAPKAGITYVYSKNVFSAVQYAVTQNLGTVISMSYGGCETGQKAAALQIQTIAQQANAQGITWLAASGDSGAAGCDRGAVATQGPAVILPASVPEVTAVGGTRFNEDTPNYWKTTNDAKLSSAVSYIPETAWNDSASAGGATGGGPSLYFLKPYWQTGFGVPQDGARDLPDVSLAASAQHDGAIICSGGSCANGLSGSIAVVGGTSFSVQVFGGIVSLINQRIKSGLGNINPTLYSLAQSSPSIFHDITTGDNIVPCLGGSTGCGSGSFGFKAGTGYDLVTGLGSVNASSLVLADGWASSIPKQPVNLTVQSLTLSPRQITGGSLVTLSLTLSAAAPFGGVTVMLSSSDPHLSIPSSVWIPPGSTSATFPLQSTPVTESTTVIVTATYGFLSTNATVTLQPALAPTLKAVAINPVTVVSGELAALTVTLSGPALTGGSPISLSSNAPNVVSVPASVTMPAGWTSGTLLLSTGKVTVNTRVTITVTANGVTLLATVTVMP